MKIEIKKPDIDNSASPHSGSDKTMIVWTDMQKLKPPMHPRKSEILSNLL